MFLLRKIINILHTVRQYLKIGYFLYIMNFQFIIIKYIKQNKDFTCYIVSLQFIVEQYKKDENSKY